MAALWDYFSSGNTGNPCIAWPTGTGKSVIPAIFIKYVMGQWPNQRFLMVTHVKELIQQNYEVLKLVWPNAPVSIYSAGLGLKNPAMPIVFGGVQSMSKHPAIFGHRDIIFIDEAHLINQHDTSMYKTFLSTMKLINPQVKIIGMSATPFRMGWGLVTDPYIDDEGKDGRLFTDIVHNITGIESFNRLIAEGYLSPLIPVRTHNELDVSSVGMQKGDFIANQLQAAVDKADINYKICQEIVAAGQDRRSWLIFASGIEHAEHLAELLRSFGISCAAVHSKRSSEDNDSAIKQFKTGRLRAISNYGKLCLDEETEILTNNGWRNIDTIDENDLIAAWSENQIEFTKPLFIVKREREENELMVSLKGKRKNIRVTSNHRMIYSTYPWNFKEASALSLVNKEIFIPISGNSIPLKYISEAKTQLDTKKRQLRINALSCVYRKKRGFDYEHSIKMATEHADYKLKYCSTKSPNDLSIEECNFIGFWLGDGTKGGERFSVAQSKNYPYIIEWFDKLILKLDINFTKSIYKPDKKSNYESVRWNFSSGKGGIGQRVKGISHLNEYLNKNGSTLYWCFSNGQLEALMNGFWLADGNHDDGRILKSSKIITGTQGELYSLLQGILVCRGYRASMTKRKKSENPNHNQTWTLIWSKGSTTKLYGDNLLRLETDFKKERVWCVTSTTSFLITRRGGKVVVMGNTTGFNHPNIDYIPMVRPTMSVPLWVQMLGRGTRPADGKLNCLVSDFARNTPRLGPINDVNIPRKKGDKTGDIPVKLCDNCGAYNHISARLCCQCGNEFQFKNKLVAKAGTEALLKSDLPIVEEYSVTYPTYAKKAKDGGAPYILVTYHCGLQAFKEFIFPEGKGPHKHKYHMWWKQRANIPPPETVDGVMSRSKELRKPRKIAVWVNKGKYHEVLRSEF